MDLGTWRKSGNVMPESGRFLNGDGADAHVAYREISMPRWGREIVNKRVVRPNSRICGSYAEATPFFPGSRSTEKDWILGERGLGIQFLVEITATRSFANSRSSLSCGEARSRSSCSRVRQEDSRSYSLHMFASWSESFPPAQPSLFDARISIRCLP